MTRDEILAELGALERVVAAKQATAQETRWCPHKPTAKQAEFLALDADDALYGGAAGGGKSDALLMDSLRGVDIPGFTALVVRKTYTDLALPGAIMDRAGEWLRPTAAVWHDKLKEWSFPSGARLTFAYLETDNDKYRYQSAEFINVAFDELTQFDEGPYRYLRSRLRRREGFPIKPHSRAASNPGGRGHRWVKRRYVDAGAQYPFVPAVLSDNPHIDQDDYAARLDDLDATTRDQLKHGLWVEDSQGLIYPIEKRHLVPEKPIVPGKWYHVLGVDLGASEDKPTTAFTVVGWTRSIEGVWCLESYKRAGMIPYTIAKEIERLGDFYGGFVKRVMDEGALGKGYGNEFRQRYAIPVEPAEKPSKLGFRKLLKGDLERTRLLFVEPMCRDLIDEAADLRWSEDRPGEKEDAGADNHCTDALLYSWRACKAFAADTPDLVPAPGSPEAVAREMREREEAEDRDGLRQMKRLAKQQRW